MLLQSSKGTTNYWISILKLKHDNALAITEVLAFLLMDLVAWVGY